MGSLRVTVRSGVLAAAAGSAVAVAVAAAGAAAALAPAAYAGSAGSVSVFPAAPAPGSDVTLRVTGCAERTAVAASTAFVARTRLTVTDAGLAGESRVRSTLEPGTYTVTVTCGTAERTGTFTVRAGDGQPPAPGSVSGAAGQPASPMTAGRSPAPGTAGQPPAPGTGGRPPVPEGGGRSPLPQDDDQRSAPDDGQPSSTGDDHSSAPGDGQPSARQEHGRPPSPGEDEQSSATRWPSAHASPVAPVEAGGGGAADLVTAADRGTGPAGSQGPTGLLLAAVGAVAIALGRFRRNRGAR